MKISIIQTNTEWENKSANFGKIEAALSVLPDDSDIIILPEMFNTGFSMNTAKLAEPSDGETFRWMKSIVGSANSAICGSYMIYEEGKYFNRFVFIAPREEIWLYDKRHLFSFAGEEKFFSPGNERLVFNFRGIRISPYICYDLRFPVWCRNRGDYDLMINSANWPESRSDVWATLLKARAIENQCYVAGVNRIGTDGNGIKYCGDSMIIGPKGNIIATAGLDSEEAVTIDISLDELNRFRLKFPVLNDADNFSIEL